MTSGEGGELPEIVGLMNDSLVDQQAPLQLEGLPSMLFFRIKLSLELKFIKIYFCVGSF